MVTEAPQATYKKPKGAPVDTKKEADAQEQASNLCRQHGAQEALTRAQLKACFERMFDALPSTTPSSATPASAPGKKAPEPTKSKVGPLPNPERSPRPPITPLSTPLHQEPTSPSPPSSLEPIPVKKLEGRNLLENKEFLQILKDAGYSVNESSLLTRTKEPGNSDFTPSFSFKGYGYKSIITSIDFSKPNMQIIQLEKPLDGWLKIVTSSGEFFISDESKKTPQGR